MPHARWWRDITLGFLAIGIACGVVLIATIPADGQFTWQHGLLLLAATGGLWALLSLVFVQRTYRADTQLRRGQGALAQWTITEA